MTEEKEKLKLILLIMFCVIFTDTSRQIDKNNSLDMP